MQLAVRYYLPYFSGLSGGYVSCILLSAASQTILSQFGITNRAGFAMVYLCLSVTSAYGVFWF